MPELSPAALAVANAYTSTPIKSGVKSPLAAALRAAADNDPNDLTTIEFDEGWGAAMDFVRAIAAELEV